MCTLAMMSLSISGQFSSTALITSSMLWPLPVVRAVDPVVHPSLHVFFNTAILLAELCTGLGLVYLAGALTHRRDVSGTQHAGLSEQTARQDVVGHAVVAVDDGVALMLLGV